MTYAIYYVKNPKQEDSDCLLAGIIENAKLQRGLPAGESFGFFLKDENGEIKGGCSGFLFYGCFYVDLLWVDIALRGMDYGTSLMLKAEKLARERHCHFFAVNTMDFEALAFYQKLGFQIEFERHGFAEDSIMYFLRKDLS